MTSRPDAEQSRPFGTCTAAGCGQPRVQGISICRAHERAWDNENWDVRPGTVEQRQQAWRRFLAEVGPR